ncbi:MAG: ribonuclease HI family protein [Thermovirgaceae bacterium]
MHCGYFDGASRGNPGEAGAGACLVDERGGLIWECMEYLGERTNNEAEYEALIMLLEEIKRRGIRETSVFGDSKLVINQVLGLWKVKEPRLQPLAARARELTSAVGARPRWVPRTENVLADRLSNRAIDESVRAQAEKKEGLRIRRVEKDIFLVHDGNELFAVDLVHGRCSCPGFFETGTCPHMEAVILESRKR